MTTTTTVAVPVWKAVKPFMDGGLSEGATCVIQPIDIVKVRLQLGASEGPIGVAAGIIKNDGFGAFTPVCLPVCCVKRRTRRLVLVSTLSSWIT